MTIRSQIDCISPQLAETHRPLNLSAILVCDLYVIVAYFRDITVFQNQVATGYGK